MKKSYDERVAELRAMRADWHERDLYCGDGIRKNGWYWQKHGTEGDVQCYADSDHGLPPQYRHGSLSDEPDDFIE